jgi:arylsulfatase A-like enzyme
MISQTSDGAIMRILPTLLATAVCGFAQTATANPNILLIIADDMGLDASACYAVATQQAPMPNIEALCAQGMVFENAYAAPVCSPTRATMLTGKYGFRTGVQEAISRDVGAGLSPDTFTLFDALAGTEYASAVIGKWHLSGDFQNLDHPNSLGVPSFFGVMGGAVRSYEDIRVVQDGSLRQTDGYATTVFTDRAIDWVSAQQSPWFLWLAYNAPHTPFHLPPTDLHSFGDLPSDPQSINADRLSYYNAALEALDHEIGRLLASLSDAQRAETVVMFIGDNGSPGQVARGLYGTRGAKGSLFEGGTNVPMIVQGPGVSPGRTNTLVNSTDFFTSISSLAGADATAPDSFDFTDALHGGDSPRPYVFVEHASASAPRGSGSLGWAIRDARFKLVAVAGEPEMLFDLSVDPFETTDLLAGAANPEALAAQATLKAAYDALAP